MKVLAYSSWLVFAFFLLVVSASTITNDHTDIEASNLINRQEQISFTQVQAEGHQSSAIQIQPFASIIVS